MNQTLFPDIIKMIRENSRSGLRNFLNAERVDVGIIDKSELVYEPWMVLVLVSGTFLRISFKIHFKMEQAKSLACSLYDLAPEAMTSEQTLDFVRELCNIIASAIKSDLANMDIVADAGLPVGVRGWEEYFFALEEHPNVSEAWSLVTAKGQLEASAAVERLTTLW